MKIKFLNIRTLLTMTFVLLVCPSGLIGQQLPEPMVPFRLVNDFTGLFSEQEQIQLNNKLLAFNNETSTQIYVVTWDDLEGFDINDYGARLGQAWGIGQENRDNGLLILVSPANRSVSIQTGYGLEGAVPDAIAKRIIEQVIIPGFREEQYFYAVDSAASVLISLTRGEYTADEYMEAGDDISPLATFIIIMIIFIIMAVVINQKQRYYSPTRSIPWWMMGSGSSNDKGWGSFNTGGGSFGGFGGGGGGSFGGGGASGRW